MKLYAKVSIILLNYNGYVDTINCLKSLKKISYENFDVVIVDNNSTDNSEQYIKSFIEGDSLFSFIQAGANIGFSAGNNIGIKYALNNGADYICLLNNDTVVEKDFLNILVREMDQNHEIGVSAGKIMYYDKPNLIWSAGGNISRIKALGIHEGINQLDGEEYNKKKEVGFLTGCFQLIRSRVFEEVGFYDEKYFLYMEDVDFCFRVKQRQYKLLYVPESKIYHKVSSSTGGILSPITIYYMSRNRLLFNQKFNKNTIYSMIFNIFYFLRLFLEPFRRGKNSKYSFQGVIDHLNRNYGKRMLN